VKPSHHRDNVTIEAAGNWYTIIKGATRFTLF